MGVNNIKSLQRQVKYIKDNLGDEVEDAVARGAANAASEARSQVLTGNQVWTGNLVNSIYARSPPGGPGFARYKVVADVPYAAFVEFGTGARSDPTAPLRFQFSAPSHTPELTAEITEWVMTKPAFFGPRTEAVAWAIARSISNIGTNPHPYMRPAWFAAKPQLIRDVRFSAKKVLRRA